MSNDQVIQETDTGRGLDRLLKTKDVTDALKTSTVSLWRLVRDGKIPKPIQLTKGGINLYKESWIQDFIDSCEAERDNVEPGKAKTPAVPKRRSRRRGE